MRVMFAQGVHGAVQVEKRNEVAWVAFREVVGWVVRAEQVLGYL